MEFNLTDRILDHIQMVFKEIKQKSDLPDATIERWHWDYPQIRLTWKKADAIWRNINVLADPSDGKAEYFIKRLEVNAWLDHEQDNRWIRNWRHEVIKEDCPLVPALFFYGYDQVANWTREDLTSQHPLSEEAARILDH